jgi:hypothetical protein
MYLGLFLYSFLSLNSRLGTEERVIQMELALGVLEAQPKEVRNNVII